jgi:SAM-dependent methyltransferase
MAAEATAAYHDILHHVERDHWWFESLRQLVVTTLEARTAPGARVLDAGCSTGHLLAAVSPSYHRTGIDMEPGAVELARRRPGIRFLTASIEAMPFQDGCFDVVVATDSISDEGVQDDRGALIEIHRVLRPGGSLILQVPAYGWLRSGHDAVTKTARRYTARTLGRLLADTGFTVEHLSYRVTALFPIAVLRRLVRRRRTQSDMARVRPSLNRALAALMLAENRAARSLRLPFGLSVFVIASASGNPDRSG